MHHKRELSPVPISDDDFKARLAATKARLDAKNSSKKAPSKPAPKEIVIKQPDTTRGVRKPTIAAAADIHKMPPYSAEAERGVLSSIMRDGQRGKTEVLEHVRQKINENFFYVPAHRTIFEMLVSLASANKPLDLISFTEFLRGKKLLDSVGGTAYVTNVALYLDELTGFVPTAANVDYYVGIVVEKFARREVIADATRLMRGAYGDEDDDFSERVQRLTNRIAHIGSIAANGRFPVLHDTAEFFTTEDPPLPQEVIYRLLHRGSKMLIGGASKGRKTWALLDLAISVATGTDWWGFHCRRGSVCYLNLELQEPFFRWRAKTLCQKKGVQPESGMLFAWNLRGHAKPMQQLVNELLGSLKQHHFSLIIIDPIYKTLPAFRGSENDSAMITQLLNEVELIAVETGAAVLFCSHFSKGDQSEKESIDRVSGSGAWARDPDSLLTMTVHEENECYSVEGTLRNLSPIYPFVVKWDFPLFVRQDELKADRLKKRGSSRGAAEKKFTLQQFVDAVRGTPPLSATQFVTRAVRKLKCSDRTAYHLFDEAKELGAITKLDKTWELNQEWKPTTANAADAADAKET